MSDRYTKVIEATQEVSAVLDDYRDLIEDVDTSESLVAIATIDLLAQREQRVKVRYERARRIQNLEFNEMDIDRLRSVDEYIKAEGEKFSRMVEQNDTIIELLGIIAAKE